MASSHNVIKYTDRDLSFLTQKSEPLLQLLAVAGEAAHTFIFKKEGGAHFSWARGWLV